MATSKREGATFGNVRTRRVSQDVSLSISDAMRGSIQKSKQPNAFGGFSRTSSSDGGDRKLLRESLSSMPIETLERSRARQAAKEEPIVPVEVSRVTLGGSSLSKSSDFDSALTSFEATGATHWTTFDVEEIFSTDRGRNLADLYARSRKKSTVLSKVTVEALERIVNDPGIKLDDNVARKPILDSWERVVRRVLERTRLVNTSGYWFLPNCTTCLKEMLIARVRMGHSDDYISRRGLKCSQCGEKLMQTLSSNKKEAQGNIRERSEAEKRRLMRVKKRGSIAPGPVIGSEEEDTWVDTRRQRKLAQMRAAQQGLSKPEDGRAPSREGTEVFVQVGMAGVIPPPRTSSPGIEAGKKQTRAPSRESSGWDKYRRRPSTQEPSEGVDGFVGQRSRRSSVVASRGPSRKNSISNPNSIQAASLRLNELVSQININQERFRKMKLPGRPIDPQEEKEWEEEAKQREERSKRKQAIRNKHRKSLVAIGKLSAEHLSPLPSPPLCSSPTHLLTDVRLPLSMVPSARASVSSSAVASPRRSSIPNEQEPGGAAVISEAISQIQQQEAAAAKYVLAPKQASSSEEEGVELRVHCQQRMPGGKAGGLGAKLMRNDSGGRREYAALAAQEMRFNRDGATSDDDDEEEEEEGVTAADVTAMQQRRALDAPPVLSPIAQRPHNGLLDDVDVSQRGMGVVQIGSHLPPMGGARRVADVPTLASSSLQRVNQGPEVVGSRRQVSTALERVGAVSVPLTPSGLRTGTGTHQRAGQVSKSLPSLSNPHGGNLKAGPADGAASDPRAGAQSALPWLLSTDPSLAPKNTPVGPGGGQAGGERRTTGRGPPAAGGNARGVPRSRSRAGGEEAGGGPGLRTVRDPVLVNPFAGSLARTKTSSSVSPSHASRIGLPPSMLRV